MIWIDQILHSFQRFDDAIGARIGALGSKARSESRATSSHQLSHQKTPINPIAILPCLSAISGRERISSISTATTIRCHREQSRGTGPAVLLAPTRDLALSTCDITPTRASDSRFFRTLEMHFLRFCFRFCYPRRKAAEGFFTAPNSSSPGLESVLEGY